MKTKTLKEDPILKAAKATNTGNAKRRAERVYREHWRDLTETRAQEEFWETHWGPAIRSARRMFRSAFSDAAWKELHIEFIGRGYSQSGITRRVEANMHYRVYWKGMFFERSFPVTFLPDVKAEAYRLAGALLGWEG